MKTPEQTPNDENYTMNQGLAWIVGVPTMWGAPIFYSWFGGDSFFGPSGLKCVIMIAALGGMAAFALWGGRRRWLVGGTLGLIGGVGAAEALLLYTRTNNYTHVLVFVPVCVGIAGALPAPIPFGIILHKDKLGG